MKILVTGGCGFIGSWIADLLVEKGDEVVVVDNLSTGKKENLANFDKLKFYEVDICNFNDLERVFNLEKPEIVFHLAANPMLRKSIENPVYDAKINILGTINVLECCKNKVRKIIYTSTGGARVGEPEYLPVDEKHFLNPCSPYGISKHTAEHYVWAYNKLYGLDYLIFCFGNVYGPRDDSMTGRLIPVFIEKMLKKESHPNEDNDIKNESPKIFGDGEQTRDFIYVKDLAGFLVNSVDKNSEHKLFHLANGKQISVNRVFRLLKEIIGFEEEAEKIEGIKGEVRDIVLDISLVKKELDWNSKTDIEKGLKESVEWFRGKDS